MTLLAGHALMRLRGGDAEEVVRCATAHQGRVAGFVVGADLVIDRGPLLVGTLGVLGWPVLADLGIVDRPEVVERAVARMGKMGARWVTVSGLAGPRAVARAVEEARRYPPMSVVVSAGQAGWAEDHGLKGVGISDTPGSHVSRLTKLALNTGAGGILFPARELGVVAQVSDARRPSGNGKGGELVRLAEVSEGISWAEMEATIRDGAHWVVVTLEQVKKMEKRA